MFFSISNLTVLSMTFIVIFCDLEEDEKIIECKDELTNLGFSMSANGFNNLYRTNNTFLVYNPKKSLEEHIFKDYQKNVRSHLSYEFLRPLEKIVYGTSYITELGKHVLNANRMLSITTWCSIHANTETDMEEFLRDIHPHTPLTQKMSERQYSKRVVQNIGIPKFYQATAFKIMKVCHKEISTTLEELKRDNLYYTNKRVVLSYYELYEKCNKSNKLDPLNWCAINVCYDALTTADFDNVSAEENIEIMINLKKTISETIDGVYAYRFYEYIKKFVEKKKKFEEDSEDNIYNIVSPYESRMLSLSQYPRNWCGINVCIDDLTKAGFIYELASDNYVHLYPEICSNSETKFNKFAVAYCEHLLNVETDNFENLTPKNPWDFCTLSVVTLDVSYDAADCYYN
uniref:Multiple inositol polyphosphate phosphatase 1 n=1 Tax=Schizaphis graminum TaxID=13262 RepID=A0A2S2NFY2_SCHGA